jgi:PadR family transcriptional regulator PadR
MEDMYGYQLVQETERSSQGKIITQEGSLYPVLYKLEQSGFISSKKVLVGKKMTRVYYHLEPKGVEYLNVLVDEYEAVTQGMFLIMNGQEENKCDSTEET